jgi:hypothetical protein
MLAWNKSEKCFNKKCEKYFCGFINSLTDFSRRVANREREKKSLWGVKK